MKAYVRNVMGKRMLFVFGICILFLMAGCAQKSEAGKKLKDLEYTVLNKSEIPQELQDRIEEEKWQPFRMAYRDQGYLYVAQGYGAMLTSGYSIAVRGLYETENAICMQTELLGPKKGEETKDATTYPYIVVKLEDSEKPVMFDE